jgi:hypothetical protein
MEQSARRIGGPPGHKGSSCFERDHTAVVESAHQKGVPELVFHDILKAEENFS